MKTGIGRLKKQIIIIISSLLTFFLFLSCGHMPDDNIPFEYPLRVGNQWVYTGSVEFKNFDPESLAIGFEYPRSSSVVSYVSNPEILNDSVDTHVIVSEEQSGIDQYKSWHYYISNEKGLFLVAYLNLGSSGVAPKNSNSLTYKFKSFHFSNLLEMSQFFQNAIQPMKKNSSDSLYYEDPPIEILKYPLVLGSQWTYRNEIGIRIDRMVEGKNIIELDLGSYECYQIKWLYDYDGDGVWDDDIWMDDYISEEGLIKRELTVIEINLMNPGGNISGTLDYYRDYTLKELSL